jgi:hypothetical protein
VEPNLESPSCPACAAGGRAGLVLEIFDIGGRESGAGRMLIQRKLLAGGGRPRPVSNS